MQRPTRINPLLEQETRIKPFSLHAGLHKPLPGTIFSPSVILALCKFPQSP